MNSGAPGLPRRSNWRALLSEEEIRSLSTMNDWKGFWGLFFNWAVVFAAFALVAVWPNPLSIVVALFVIGGRQLGFSIFMHDAAHYAFLGNRKINDGVANWLAAYPVWGDVEPYRPYHLQHHAYTWQEKDPDVSLASPFPITSQSLRRKVWRDLSGQTGFKRAVAIWKRDLGLSQGKSRRRDGGGFLRFRGVLITNGILLGLLWAAGHPALYLLWVVAWLTTYSLAMRIRSIAEHSMPLDPSDETGNTRTILASWWERLLLAPNHVNYHLEHHLLMRVPHYNLPRLHGLLRERGVLDEALVTRGYLPLLKAACSKPASGDAAGAR
jgi:fatty acid desaturase